MKERKGRTNKEWRGRKNRRKTQEERTRGRVTWNKAFTILHKKYMYKYMYIMVKQKSQTINNNTYFHQGLS